MSNPITKHAIYLNGALYIDDEIETAMIPTADRGLLLGDGLFETLPIINGQALWWDLHKERVLKSANQIDLQLDPMKLDDAIVKLTELCKNANGVVRLTVTRGSGGRGLAIPKEQAPIYLASLAPMPQGLAFADATLITATIRRNENSPTSRLKSLNYLDNILATREAEQAGADDALMLNSKTRAACTTICNLFAISDNQITTPPLSDGVLPGIVRSKVIELAPQWGFTIAEQSLLPDQLKKADGLFLTNSLRFIRRVTRLDDKSYMFTEAKDDPIGTLQDRMRDLIHETTDHSL